MVELAQKVRNYLKKVVDKVIERIPYEKRKKAIKTTKIVMIPIVFLFLFFSIVTISSAKVRESEQDFELSFLKRQLDEKNLKYITLEEKSSSELNSLEVEFEKYKEKMKPYEELEETEARAKVAEANAKKAELEKKEAEEKAKIEAEKKAKEAEEKAKTEGEAAKKKQEEAEKQAQIEAEEARGYETGTTFDQLARTPDDFDFTKVKFSGKIIQVMEDSDTTKIRFAVNDDYDNIIYAELSSELTQNNRVLEDDYITISGISMGLLSYESTMGGNITIPSVVVDKIDR